MTHFILNQVYRDFHNRDFLQSDPIEYVHRYKNPWDQEAVGLVASLLAYGNVKQIRNSVSKVCSILEDYSGSPSAAVKSLARPKNFDGLKKKFEPFVHRFNVGSDIIELLDVVRLAWEEDGSLGSHFLKNRGQDMNLQSLMTRFMRRWRGKSKSPGYSFFMTDPEDGSTCKRWSMFLRWMGRKDQIDLGLWNQNGPFQHFINAKDALKSSELFMPLDTHTGRISYYIGLTDRKTSNWKTVLEVTDNLKKIDNDDPIRFDFSLSRLGILDICQKKYQAKICESCSLLPACRFAKSKGQMGRHL